MGGSWRGGRPGRLVVIILAGLIAPAGGCAEIPIAGRIETRSAFRGDAHVNGRIAATVDGPIKVEIPTASDPGPMIAVPVRAGNPGSRIGIVDVDGLILNQNLSGLYSVGENPVSGFREKLQAAAADSGRRIALRTITGQPLDHPEVVTIPETGYLKGALLEALD